MSYILNHIDNAKFGVLLSLYTGLRIGELCGLQWQEVTDNAIQINHTLQRLKNNTNHTSLFLGQAKSFHSVRTIPLPECLRPLVEQFRKAEGWVLSTKNNTPIEPRTMQQKFSQIVTECQIYDVTFHTLRHTFVTRCIEAGFDVKSLSEILGHSNVKTTMNLYVHPSFDYKKENMKKLQLP